MSNESLEQKCTAHGQTEPVFRHYVFGTTYVCLINDAFQKCPYVGKYVLVVDDKGPKAMRECLNKYHDKTTWYGK